MSVLDVLKNVKRELLAPAHLLKSEDISVRFPYMVGVAMVTRAEGELTTDKKAYLADMALSLGLLDEQLSQVLDATTEAEIRPDIIFTIVEALNKKEQQYAFILDLYRAGWSNGKIGPVARKMTSEFAEMLKISASELQFLQDLVAAIMIVDLEKAATIMDSEGDIVLNLPINVLKYFLPGVKCLKIELLQGEQLFYQGCFKEALKIFEIVSRNNNPRAMYFYGTILQDGLGGITKNKEIAQANFRQGAILGDPFCQYKIAQIMQVEDPENASRILLEACKDLLYLARNDDKEAQWIVGQVFSCDFVIKKDEATSCHWFRKAAMQGCFRAQCSLGHAYYSGKGVRQDYAEASACFLNAAELGFCDAQLSLATCYFAGQGVKKDYTEAVKWYRKAAEQGCSDAQVCLGECYRYGTGVAPDKSEAIKWYCKAAEQGNEHSQKSLKELC